MKMNVFAIPEVGVRPAATATDLGREASRARRRQLTGPRTVWQAMLRGRAAGSSRAQPCACSMTQHLHRWQIWLKKCRHCRACIRAPRCCHSPHHSLTSKILRLLLSLPTEALVASHNLGTAILLGRHFAIPIVVKRASPERPGPHALRSLGRLQVGAGKTPVQCGFLIQRCSAQ